MKGVLFLVVGPSGSGKDTLLDGARAQLGGNPNFVFCRRVITRPAEAGGEAHEPVSETEFEARLNDGHLFIAWQAHGLHYGIPNSIRNDLDAGRHVLVNVSRTVIDEMSRRHADLRVIEVKAPIAILAKRLAARGRESESDIAARLSRKTNAIATNVEVLTVENDGTPDEGIKRFVDAIIRSVPGRLKIKRIPIDTWRDNICFLHRECTAYSASDYLGPSKVDIFSSTVSIQARVNLIDDDRIIERTEIGLSYHTLEQLGLPEGAEVMLERPPPPASLPALRGKIAGEELSLDQMRQVIHDIVEYRYTEREIAAFLVAATKGLSLDEVKALTLARASYAHRFTWPRNMIVDKHSMGGVSGSRVSMIIIPIVAAHGLWIPKTSSRAITSAAGTADAMECVANVGLSPEAVRQTVEEAGGCIAWNGRLSHSPVDDVMNSITRPLGIDSATLAVTSILSKKLAAGSSHAIIDIPVGPGTKVVSQTKGQRLAGLFEEVGAGIGMTVNARITDASQPIGRGIGPALEVRDVFKVLRNEPDAPVDLRAKALDFATAILAWDPELNDTEARARATELLESGAALMRLNKIIDLQGRLDHPAEPGALIHEVRAPASGVVSAINSYQISSIARQAGAPMDKGAGVDLLMSTSASIKAGETLYRIHANVGTDFRLAIRMAEANTGFRIC